MQTAFFRPGFKQRWLTLIMAACMVLSTALSTLVITPRAAHAQHRDPAYAEFYQTLDQHGEWIEHPRYGMTWAPYANQDRGWRPYSRGQWVMTEEHGWFWESDEDFGWIVYHYGRWLLDERHGWMWVPGREWGPAWVAWREGEEAIGWAPLPPEAEFDGYGEGVMTYEAFASPRYAPMWMFVAPALMLMPAVYRHFHPYQRSSFYFGQSRFVTHYSYRDRHVYNRGIDRRFIEMRSQRPVPVLQVRPMQSPRDFGGGAGGRRFEGDRRQVGVYRPQLAPAPQRGGPGFGQGPGPGFGQGRSPQQGFGGGPGATGSAPGARPFGPPGGSPQAAPPQPVPSAGPVGPAPGRGFPFDPSEENLRRRPAVGTGTGPQMQPPVPNAGSASPQQQQGQGGFPGGRPFGGGPTGNSPVAQPQPSSPPPGGPPTGFGGGFGGGRPQPQAMPPSAPPQPPQQRPQVQAPSAPPSAPSQFQRPPPPPPAPAAQPPAQRPPPPPPSAQRPQGQPPQGGPPPEQRGPRAP